MNKLKPIKWFDCKNGTGVESVTPLSEYDVWKEDGTDSWVVSYYDRQTE